MEKSKVYFTSFKATGNENLLQKLHRLIKTAGFENIDFKDKYAAIKIHFGEYGNLAFLRPNYARVVADYVKELGGKPFLTDCNTLYVGSRKNALDHLETAYVNGFSPYQTGCHVLIADGLKGTDETLVPVNGEYVKEAKIGSIVAISGIADIHIGDTICDPENPVAIPFQKISEPTISMNFIVNDSPLAGQEGKYITSRHIRDRLFKELNTDVSLRVEETDSADSFKVSGRGELHLSVLIENMRREGYEFAVSKAEVLYHTDENGKKTEPMEQAYIDVPDEFTGVVIEKLSQRKGELQNMGSISGGYTRLEFKIPSRGLIGYRGDFMTDTKGNGIINTIFCGYEPYRGDIQYRKLGSLIAFESGESVAYGLFSAQERGSLFIGPGEKVYSGMVIGQCSRGEDIELNVCKKKHLTNTRSSSADEALTLTPPRILSLEQALDFIDTDELLEVTPESLRIRKKILDPTLRKRASFKK